MERSSLRVPQTAQYMSTISKPTVRYLESKATKRTSMPCVSVTHLLHISSTLAPMIHSLRFGIEEVWETVARQAVS